MAGFIMRPALTLELCRKAAAACEAEALKNAWKVTICVVDDGGHPLLLQRMDGCAPASALIAPQKARTAALGRKESKGVLRCWVL